MSDIFSTINDFKIRHTKNCDEIYDCLRGKYVALTPEELVRQSFVNFLLKVKGYPMGLMNNEVSICQNGISRRCDSVVFDKNGVPLMIIEYKSRNVAITQNVFNQIYRYNLVLKVKYLVVFNGINLYCCLIDYDNNSFSFLKGIPDYNNL